jgi:KaiC/GvpD/RAD55 family RecA-like ATPase
MQIPSLRLLAQPEGLRIPILSDILGYPVPRHKFLVGLYEPSSHWLSLILTMASNLLRSGNVVNIVTTATPPSQIRFELGRTVPNLSELESGKKFFLSDWHTWLTGKKSEEAISLESLSIMKMSLDESSHLKGFSPTYDLAVVDNFSSILKYNDERTFMQWFDRFVATVKQLRGIRLYGFVKRFHSENLYSNVEALADGVIELDYSERDGKLENTIRVKSLKGMPHSTEWHGLSVLGDGSLQLSKKNRE